ncbi:MAG: aminotransferase class V-fold PLP-dependent enzyme [Planctomycetota bacterium]
MTQIAPRPTATDDAHLPSIAEAIAALGDGPLTDVALRAHIDPLFSRVLQRDEIYLANHSLGRPLDRMAEDVRTALDHWYIDMDGAWGPWMEAVGRYRSLMAELIGCARPDAIVPKTSAGQGLRAALGSLRTAMPKIVSTMGEFDSIEIVLKAWSARGRANMTWVPAGAGGLFHGDDVAAAITHDTDAVVVSQVIYATGQVVDGIDKVIARAREVGAIVILDTYHSAGAMPVGFDDLGADFAIGGNYKYTRGGAGACWLAVHPRHLRDAAHQAGIDGLFPIDTGWFAKAEAFDWSRPDEPSFAAGGDGWMESTPPVLAFIQAIAGLELTVGLGPARLREYNRGLQEAFIGHLRAHGVEPRVLPDRGAFVLVPTGDLSKAIIGLKDRGINVDGRPDPAAPRSQTAAGNVRFCPDILTRTDELERAASIVADVWSQTQGR